MGLQRGSRSRIFNVSVSYFNPYRMFAVRDSGQIIYSTSPGGFEWQLREIESAGYNTTLATNLSSIDVVSSSRILFTGPDGYLGLSLDQGLNVERNILPSGVNPHLTTMQCSITYRNSCW